MHILLVSVDFPPNVGGVAAHVYELGRELARQGHSVEVITGTDATGMEGTMDFAGMQVHRYRLGHRLWVRRRLAAILRREVPAMAPEVIHVHGIKPLTATRNLGVPVVFTNHTSGFLQRIERGERAVRRVARMMSHLSLVISPSRELMDAAVTARVPGEKSVFLANGVDIERFKPGLDGQALRSRWGIEGDEVVVLAARRMVEKNGLIYLAEAAPDFLRAGVRLVLVGDGPEHPRVLESLQAAGLEQYSLLTGSIDNGQMPEVYAASDIVVLPSLKEATSITGLEAMACAKPLVGTRVGGIPELVIEGENGLLVPSADPRGLGQAIATMVRDKAFRDAAGMASRRRVEAHFSWGVIARETLKHYKSVL